jgi:hypothetical protein
MNPTKFFEAQLKELVHDCLYGQLHYRTWQRLNRSFGNELETMEVASLFFESTAVAHLNSARLHLYRLLDVAKGSTSIYEIIKFAENNKEIFPNQVKLDSTLERHRKLMIKLKPSVENIREQRKKHFVHKSKKYLNIGYDKLYTEYSATYKDYEEVLIATSEMLNDYLVLLNKAPFYIGFPMEQDDFENLKYYLNKGIKAVEEEKKL